MIYEHMSGLTQTLIASVSGNNITAESVSTILDINRKTAQAAKRKRKQYNTSKIYIPLLTPPSIKRIKFSQPILSTLLSWLESNTTLSSKQSNVVTYMEDGIMVNHQLHYRTVSL